MSKERYAMCKDQPAQIDCKNISPAITLGPEKIDLQTMKPVDPHKMKVICWSYELKT